MHGIKYFFLNKNNQTIRRGGKKKFQGGQITENIIEKHYFSKSKEGTCPPWITLGPPLVTELSPDAYITGILTAWDIEYAATSVGEAYKPFNFIKNKK
jgi:hypothetical protein